MQKLTYALIGCGRISPNHMEAVTALKDKLTLTALCDLVPENIQKCHNRVRDTFDNIKEYTDYKAMICEVKPDLVAVATDSGLHEEIGLFCMEQGCHVIIEKPIALSMKGARALVAKAKEKGVVFSASHQNRFNKSIIAIREAVEAGRFGKLHHGNAVMRWIRDEGYYKQAPWRGTWAQDGGALMNQSIHNIDLLRWMMGDDIDEVMAYTDQFTHPYMEAEDFGLAIIKFSNGSYGTVEATVNVYPNSLEETLSIFGETGTVRAAGKSVNLLDVWRFEGEDEQAAKEKSSQEAKNVYGQGHTLLYADVVDAIQNNRPPLIDGEAGLRAVELVLAIYQSAKEHRPVSLPLGDFSTMDMAGSFKD